MALIRCLNTVCVSHESGETSLPPAQQRILSLLVAAGPTGLTSEQWAEETYFGVALPDKWNGAFRKAMSRLRRSVDVVTENGRYRINDATHEVDVWQLRNISPLDLAAVDEDHVQSLLRGDPFPGIELSPRLSEAVEEIAARRLALVQGMVDSPREQWSPITLHAVRTLTARRHYDETLLEAAVRLHLGADRIAEAAHLVDAAKKYLRDELGVNLDQAIRNLVGAGTPPAAAAGTSWPIDGRMVGRTQPQNKGVMVRRTGLIAAVESGLASGGVLLRGDSGTGKTSLLHAVVDQRAASGHHVLWLTGRRNSPAAYAPFLAAVPRLEQDLAALLEGGGADLLRTKCWSAARRRLAAEFAGLPLTLVVDDAQWLDSHSQQLVSFLGSSVSDPPVHLLVAGRRSMDTVGWEEFADGLERIGVGPADVAEFSREEMVELIGICHPHSTSKQRRDFAAELEQRRASLPLIAQELVAAASPQMLTLTEYRGQSRGPEIWAHRIDRSTGRVAAVAAVLGVSFRVADLAALAELPLEHVVQITDELVEAEILVSEQRPDEFSFRHVLIHREFDQLLSRSERRQLHLNAVALDDGCDGVHRRARHVGEARALMDQSEVVEAVLASARAFEADGSYREAVTAFAQARLIADVEIPASDLITYVAAVASSGGDSWDIRSTAFEVAHSNGDDAMCLDIALAGVRRTEDSLGDERRITMLERIDASNLVEGLRIAHAAALARELGLLGRHERALEVSGFAIRSATTTANKVDAWLGGWAACRAVPPQEWPPMPEHIDEVTDPQRQTRLALITCAQALVHGDDARARTCHQQAEVLLAGHTEPLLEWHASLASALFSFVDGDWQVHQAKADEALSEGSRHGVNAAFSSRAAQMFVQQWLLGRHVELLPLLETGPPDLQKSLLAQAALAATLAAVPDRHSDARVKIAHVAATAAERRSPFSHPAAALVASVPPELLTPQVRKQLLGVLEPFDGTALAVGAGISHLGPVSWSLANLAVESDDRASLLRRSMRESDRWRLKLWSVRTRLDLFASTGEVVLLDEIREIAEGTDLVALIPDGIGA